MMTSGVIELTWADGKHVFKLNLPQLEELQDLTGKGVFAVFTALVSGEWTTNMVRHTIRLGLVGGGMEPAVAADTVRRYVDEKNDWIENAQFAYAILGAALTGPNLAEGELNDSEKKPVRRVKAGSTSKPSTPTQH